VTCEDIRKLLNPYADGELGLTQGLEIEDHLRGCDGCRRELESIRALRKAIMENATYHDAPDDLEVGVRAAAGLRSRAQADREPYLPPFGWGLIAMAAIVALVLVFMKESFPSAYSIADLTTREVVDDHIRSLMANHLTDVASSDQRVIKSWFDGRIDFVPQVRDLAAQGFALAGGRLDYVNGHQAVAIVYRSDGRTINQLMWPMPNQPDSPAAVQTRYGYNIVHWTKDGMAYWAVSDLEPERLEDFARLVREGPVTSK
jgi:anti-sigma factor RsiW